MRRPDIGFIPTPFIVVEAVLELAAIQSHDIFYDLGSGDGRILLTAAQRFGTTGIGLDIDRDRVEAATQKAVQAGVSDRVTFYQQDLYHSDFSQATVVFVYLLPHLNLRLRPLLFQQLHAGTRVLSLDFDMGEWPPEASWQLPIGEADELATLYRWTMPRDRPLSFVP